MSGKKSASADPIRVLYDGWPLADASVSEPLAALHLLELLTARPENIEPWLALPGDPGQDLGVLAQVLIAPEPPVPAGRLRWEQLRLPALARQIGAQVIHTTSTSLPLFSPSPCLVSPVESLMMDSAGRQGIAHRLRKALGQGGLSGAAWVLWPDDLPAPQTHAKNWRMPVYVHPAFYLPQTSADLPPAPYILAPGPLDAGEIALLAAVWSWVSAGLGEEWLLLVSDLPPAGLEQMHHACKAMGMPAERYTAQVNALDLRALQTRAAAFQQAQVVLLVSQVRPWSDALLHALACGRPIAGVETPWSDARVGPAGYLTPASDPRALGAAVLTLIVEEEMAERLGNAASQRANRWQGLAFHQKLGEVYAEVPARSR